MAPGSSDPLIKAADEYFDALIKSRFIEMFGNIDTNSSGGQTRLEYIGKFVTGGTPSSKHPEYYDGNIPWISSTALGPNYIDSSVAKYNITYEAIQKSSTVLIPPYSLIVGTRINVGGASVNTDALCTCQDVVSVVNIPPDYNPLFLKFCIDYYKPRLDSLKRGATIKGINISDLKKLLIPSIPIGTQNAFVNFVKQVDKSKLVFRTMVSKCNDLVASRFKEINTCDIPKTRYKLDDLIEQCATSEKVEKTDNEIYVTLQSKGKGAKKRTISEGKKPVTFTGYRIKTGQFMYSRIDARNGAFAIVPDELNNAVVSKDFPVFNINTDAVTPTYLLNYVTQDVFIDQIRNNSFGATNRQRIKEDTLLKYTVNLPPLAIQNQFADFVKQVDKLKSEILEGVKKLRIPQ